MTRLLGLLLCLTWPTAAVAADTNAIADAVRNLGAADHKTREAATRFLADAGPPAIAFLERAVQDPDPEIRLRAAELLAVLRLALPADLPAPLRDAALRFETLPPEDQRITLRRLYEHGPTTRPALLELARRVRAPQTRAELFDDVLETLVLSLHERLHSQPLHRDTAARLREDVELYQTLLPDDPLPAILAIRRLDAAGCTADADQIFAATFATLQKQCAAEPGNPERHNNLAWLCAVARRRLDDGLKHIAIGLQAAPRAAPLLDTKAELLFQKGQKAEALALIEQAIELDPETEYFKKQRDRFTKGDPSVPPPEPDHHDH